PNLPSETGIAASLNIPTQPALLAASVFNQHVTAMRLDSCRIDVVIEEYRSWSLSHFSVVLSSFRPFVPSSPRFPVSPFHFFNLLIRHSKPSV
ncbi:hypothetical protein JZU61_03605, partial [bacterium]|nr:hypothetical protein [bacterium]